MGWIGVPGGLVVEFRCCWRGLRGHVRGRWVGRGCGLMGKGGWTIVRADLGLLDVGFGPFGAKIGPKTVKNTLKLSLAGCGVGVGGAGGWA